MFGSVRLTVSFVIAGLALAITVSAATAGGALRIASDVSYAPLEFYRPNTKAVEGFDYDLAQALGKQMGETVDFRNHDFATMIPDLKAGKVRPRALGDVRHARARTGRRLRRLLPLDGAGSSPGPATRRICGISRRCAVTRSTSMRSAPLNAGTKYER